MLVGIEVKHRYLDVIASFFKADVYITWSSNWLDLRLDSYHIWTPSKSYLQELGDLFIPVSGHTGNHTLSGRTTLFTFETTFCQLFLIESVNAIFMWSIHCDRNISFLRIE